ncbi:hypothetical protein AB0E74_17165 [Streptomyces sp. NPDC030392]|uniref:hypothetical protein n=1 Tax=Streptomyces sp. NPDC030392 TaxID=3155468 RepID=UPI0033EEB96B
MENKTICRICGYGEEVLWKGGRPTAAICPGCGHEPDVGDSSLMSPRNCRGYRVGHGAQRHSPLEERKHLLRGWDLLRQMATSRPEWR